MAAAAGLEAAALEALKKHGIGEVQPPAKPELWQEFRARPEVEEVRLDIENRFYAGYSQAELDWEKPVHALLVDFKGDGMQLGNLLERLEQRGDQYVFLGNPPPFNGGWHFSAVNDFEHPEAQAALDPAWRNIRIWHRVNFVPTTTEAGLPGLVSREDFNPAEKQKGAWAVDGSRKLSSIYLLGGLMPHTLIATALADNGPAGLLLAKHLELGAKFVAMGHGLDVLIATGTPERSLIEGFEVAIFPKQDRLAEITGLKKSQGDVCSHEHTSGARLVSASHCGPSTFQAWLEAADLPPPTATADALAAAAGGGRMHSVQTTESIFSLDMAKLPGMDGSEFDAGAEAPRVAIFADEVADPIEIYTIVTHLLEVDKFSFQLVSHSDEPKRKVRRVTTETVFGNAMYGLCDCNCVLSTAPANTVAESTHFDGFFVAGGQCPYHLLQDAAVTRIMDSSPVAAAVCHGPEALAGSKWLKKEGAAGGKFVSYYGAWMSFRDVLSRYDKKKPGETCQDASGRLFSGNAPNATKAMTVQACAAIRQLKAGDSA